MAPEAAKDNGADVEDDTNGDDADGDDTDGNDADEDGLSQHSGRPDPLFVSWNCFGWKLKKMVVFSDFL